MLRKYKRPDRVYRAEDYLRYSAEAKATFSYIVGAVAYFIMMVFGPMAVDALSMQGEIVRWPSRTGAIILTGFLVLYLLTMRKKLNINQKGLYLMSDTAKGLALAMFIYFIVAWIWSYARFWNIAGYWAVCAIFGFFNSIVAIGVVIIRSSKPKDLYR